MTDNETAYECSGNPGYALAQTLASIRARRPVPAWCLPVLEKVCDGWLTSTGKRPADTLAAMGLDPRWRRALHEDEDALRVAAEGPRALSPELELEAAGRTLRRKLARAKTLQRLAGDGLLWKWWQVGARACPKGAGRSAGPLSGAAKAKQRRACQRQGPEPATTRPSGSSLPSGGFTEP